MLPKTGPAGPGCVIAVAMLRFRSRGTGARTLLLVALGLLGCDDVATARRAKKMSVTDEQPTLAQPTGTFKQRIGTVALRAEIHAAPTQDSTIIGTLVAGSLVPRSDDPVGRDGCPSGWYATAPRGYLCLDKRTTLDENHPTLKARALPANRDNTLPYPFARTRRDAPLYELDPKHLDGVRERRKLAKDSVFAVVGSWNTLDDFDQRQRLAMLTSGQFVPIRDIEPAKVPSPIGSLVDGTERRLPLGLVVIDSAFTKSLTGGHMESKAKILRGQALNLNGSFRSLDGERYWALAGDGYIEERGVKVFRKRQDFPRFAEGMTRWIDLDLREGTLLLYEGRTPTFATTVLRLPTRLPEGATAVVRSKQITVPSSVQKTLDQPSERLDFAWVIELSDGTTIRAGQGSATSGDGNANSAIELYPDDAHRLFQWVKPEVPATWHGVITSEPEREGSPILLH